MPHMVVLLWPGRVFAIGLRLSVLSREEIESDADTR